MLNTILNAIYHTYLEDGFKKQYGIYSSIDFGNIDLELLDNLCKSDLHVTVKTKKSGYWYGGGERMGYWRYYRLSNSARGRSGI